MTIAASSLLRTQDISAATAQGSKMIHIAAPTPPPHHVQAHTYAYYGVWHTHTHSIRRHTHIAQRKDDPHANDPHARAVSRSERTIRRSCSSTAPSHSDVHPLHVAPCSRTHTGPSNGTHTHTHTHTHAQTLSSAHDTRTRRTRPPRRQPTKYWRPVSRFAAQTDPRSFIPLAGTQLSTSAHARHFPASSCGSRYLSHCPSL